MNRLIRANSPPDADAPPNGADLIRIRAPNPGPMTLTGTNTYVIDREPCWVIDPGPDDAAHIDRVRAECEDRGEVAGVLLTHSHADHSAGVERLGAPVVWGEASPHDETGLADASGAADVPQPRRTDPSGTRMEGAGRSRSVEGAPFRVYATPGHAADHVCFEWGEVLFCGDLVLGEGSTIVPAAAFGGSLTDYMRSLELVRDIQASLFAPGHGPWITDPAARIAGYLDHRRERERKLVAALASGERSREALLATAWDDVPTALRPAAAVAMQAHLEKLEAEGRLPGKLEE